MNRLGIILFLLLLCSPKIWAQDDVIIPNIITPNDDNLNDVFSIRASGYVALTCTIINRYGEPVYRFYGLNGTWDAYTHAGIKVVAGTYFVYVELEKPDGTTETRQGTLQVQY
jgi:gliding motility-associated-like protein